MSHTDRILMCPPDYFTVEYVINPWMAGNAGSMSIELACRQWETLKDTLGRYAEIVTIDPTSVADGLGAPFAGRWTLAMCRALLDGIVLLDDATILAGVRFGLERLKQLLEPAGAAALAAVLAGRLPIADGERVAVVLSGGNVNLDQLRGLRWN